MIARLRRTTESNKSFEQTPKASSVSNGRQLLWFNGFDSAAQLNSVLGFSGLGYVGLETSGQRWRTG
jgi:hypothetical protein